MTKSKKDNKKITSIKKEIEKISEIKKSDDVVDIDSEEEQIDESLPEDVEDALGINKVKKAIKSEVDYISELEGGFDGFDPFYPDEDLKGSGESDSDDDF